MNNSKFAKVTAGLMALVLVLVTTVFATETGMGTGNAEDLQTGTGEAKYVFYFIGDGMGASQRQLAEYFLQETTDDGTKLMMNQLPYAAIDTSHALNTLITDSAAGGTALATGNKTNSGMVSVLPDGTELKTLQELAEEKGMATGIATTTRITHATPAVFISHNADRDDENAIAADYLDSGVDYLVGGGVRHFLPQGWVDAQKDAIGSTIKSKRKDDRNLIQEFTDLGYTVDYGEMGVKNFRDYTPETGDQYVNFFTYSHLPYSVDVQNSDFDVPSLADITAKGIDLLSKDEDGFFFMLEAGRIDHACHPNDPMGAIQDTLALDEAIKVAFEFYEAHPDETLIVVAADHETGGLGLGIDADYFLTLDTLVNSKMSFDMFVESEYAYNGDRELYMKNIAELFGLTELTELEMAMLERGMDLVDKGELDPSNGEEYDEAALAVNHIVSERAGVMWTSYAHTGTQLPVSAVGVGGESINGFIDNTDVAKRVAAAMGVAFE